MSRYQPSRCVLKRNEKHFAQYSTSFRLRLRRYSVKSLKKGQYTVHIAGQPDRQVTVKKFGEAITGTAGNAPAGDKNKKPAAPKK